MKYSSQVSDIHRSVSVTSVSWFLVSEVGTARLENPWTSWVSSFFLCYWCVYAYKSIR